MLVREARKLVLFVGPVVALLFLAVRLLGGDGSDDNAGSTPILPPSTQEEPAQDNALAQTPQEDPKVGDDKGSGNDNSNDNGNDNNATPPPESHEATHIEISSVSMKDGRYFSISFGDENAMNPNIIPHPHLDDSWVIVAQRLNKEGSELAQFAELACYASFSVDADGYGLLQCQHPPEPLPIVPTTGTLCDGELSLLTLNSGPHDGRVFQGPRGPYTIYGSNSRFTCFGQFVQDLQVLMGWGKAEGGGEDVDGHHNDTPAARVFSEGTEMQRPAGGAYSPLEKNWFLFWDRTGQTYVHYDVYPSRSFAQLEADGSVGEDLAPLAATAGDDACLARLMPRPGPELESVHQATNTLAVTLCRRADPGCLASEHNTFLFTLFHHKSHHGFHSEYEPYALLFHQDAPFAAHAVSRRPIWVRGRTTAAADDSSALKKTDMFYLVSLSWRNRSQRYHGYLDDVLFVSIGIEDKETAGIDVLAGDLLADLALCSEG